MNDSTISGDGQTVWLYVYVGGSEHEQWSRDIEDYASYQKVELKDANGGSNVYTTTYYNNSNYTEGEI